LNRQRQTGRGSWRARDFGRGLFRWRAWCAARGVLTFGPTSSIPVLQLGFLLHIFCKLSTLSIGPRAATASLPTCQPAGPAPATEARRCVLGCFHYSRLNHSAVVCRPRLPGTRRGHTAAARLSCSICHRHQYRQYCC
jgi:hypothetical protein